MLPQRQKSEKPSIFRSLDWFTVVLYLLMVAAGAVSIYAASYDFDEASLWSFNEFSGKQIRWIGASLLIGSLLLLVETRVYETYAYVIYAVLIVVLIITPFIAHDIKGSKSWIGVGAMSIQPAEFAKFATALALARLFSGYNFVLNASLMNYVKACLIILMPVVFILMEKETGTALVFLSLFFVLYREGMNGLILLSALMAVVIFVVAVKFTEVGAFGITQGQMWIYIGVMVMVVVMLCIYAQRRLEIARRVLLWFAGTGIVLALIANFTSWELPGTIIFISIIGIALVYILIEELRMRITKLLIPVAGAIIAISFMFTVDFAFQHLQRHQQKRILVVLGIEEDLRGVGYNVNQSKIAIGSGGMWGKGFLNGTQTKLKYVPEQHTDFIFCTIGEEEGFWGTICVELLFIMLICRVVHIAERQPKVFGRVYAYCVASYFIFHFCVNIGMVIGLCPVIGIPLPFFSYGGSSMLGFTILLFILLRIDASRKSYLNTPG